MRRPPLATPIRVAAALTLSPAGLGRRGEGPVGLGEGGDPQAAEAARQELNSRPGMAEWRM